MISMAFIPVLPLRPKIPYSPLSRISPLSRRQPRRYSPTALLSRAKIPMALTYVRIAAIPLLFLTSLPLPYNPNIPTALFASASITDFFDGYLARRWNVVSPMGIFLDPVADKLMVAVALTVITARLPHPLISFSTALILSREIFVSALREWMAIAGRSAVVKVSWIGKLKTAVQMISVTILLFSTTLSSWYAYTGMALLAVAAALAVLSATDYVTSAVKVFRT